MRAPKILSGLPSLQEVDNGLDRNQSHLVVARLVCTRAHYFCVEGTGPSSFSVLPGSMMNRSSATCMTASTVTAHAAGDVCPWFENGYGHGP
jgi:hypothetical protein